MTRELVAAMHEYLQAADSLERMDVRTNEAGPVLNALRVARRKLLDQLTAFETTVGIRESAVSPAVAGDEHRSTIGAAQERVHDLHQYDDVRNAVVAGR